MKILMIYALAAFAHAGTAGILRSNSHSINIATAGMPTMQELHSSANVDKLPAGDFEDRSLVFFEGNRAPGRVAIRRTRPSRDASLDVSLIQ
jgi:hypothetical protein